LGGRTGLTVRQQALPSRKESLRGINFPIDELELAGWHEARTADRHSDTQDEARKEGITMKKFTLASIVGGGLVAAVVGFAAPAQADLSHNIWANQQNGTSATVPHADNSVHQSR
jgi:hypothetical protein